MLNFNPKENEMVWSWSHTEDGVQNVMNRIAELDDDTLVEVYAEWTCAQIVSGRYVFCESRYTDAKVQGWMLAHNLRAELIEFVQDKTRQHAECDNGGFNAHICPFNCHSVSFGEPEEMEEDHVPF